MKTRFFLENQEREDCVICILVPLQVCVAVFPLGFCLVQVKKWGMDLFHLWCLRDSGHPTDLEGDSFVGDLWAIDLSGG